MNINSKKSAQAKLIEQSPHMNINSKKIADPNYNDLLVFLFKAYQAISLSDIILLS